MWSIPQVPVQLYDLPLPLKIKGHILVIQLSIQFVDGSMVVGADQDHIFHRVFTPATEPMDVVAFAQLHLIDVAGLTMYNPRPSPEQQRNTHGRGVDK